MTWRATVLTLYPDMFPGPLGQSIAGRALADQRWSLDTMQIRDFATDKHRTVDDTPAGGGAGMVLRADVVAAALDSVSSTAAAGIDAAAGGRSSSCIRCRVAQSSAGAGGIRSRGISKRSAGRNRDGLAAGAQGDPAVRR